MRSSVKGVLVAAGFALGLVLAACVENTSTPDLDAATAVKDGGGGADTDAQEKTDAGKSDAGLDATLSADSADAAELKCTPIAQQGQPVTVTNAPLPEPVANGGGFTPGTYVRTSIKKYGDAPVVTMEKEQTIFVTSTSIKLVTGPTAGGTEQRSHLDYRTREQYIFFKVYCDTVTANVGTEFDARFNATATTITLFTEPTDGTTGVVETTYTMQ